MFDIGFIELLVIGVVGLVVIGPERLPGVASKLGRWVGRARHFAGTVKRDIDREIRQEEIRQALDRDAGLDEIKNIINDSKYTIEDVIKGRKAIMDILIDGPRGIKIVAGILCWRQT